MEAFRAFYRFALWSLLIGAIGGIIAGWCMVAYEVAFQGITIRYFARDVGISSLYGAIIGFAALLCVGLPTGMFLAILKATFLKHYRFLPYVCAFLSLGIFYPLWFSLSDGSYNDYIDEQFVFRAVAVVVGAALLGASYRIVMVDSRYKIKAKRSE